MDTPRQIADRMIAAVEGLFAAAAGKAAGQSGSVYNLVHAGSWLNPLQQSVNDTMNTTRVQLDFWEGDLLTQAIRGTRDDGSPYTWGEWADVGKTLGEQIKRQFGLMEEGDDLAGPWANLKGLAQQTYDEIKPTLDDAWGTVKLVLLGAAVLVGTAFYLRARGR